jgi:hypothetical protein
MKPAPRTDARKESARKAFADAIVASKSAPTAEPTTGSSTARHERDDELERMRRELADGRGRLDSERAAFEAERGKQRSPEDDLEAYVGNPTSSVRGWIESMHGKLDDQDYRREVADLVTTLASEVLKVPLPAATRAKIDAAQARKMVAAPRTAAARRDAKARERENADREARSADEQKTASITQTLKGQLGQYPHLAAQPDGADLVIAKVRAAGQRGERLAWRDAARDLDDRLKADAEKRKPPAPKAEPPAPRPRSLKPGQWDRTAHRAATLASLRKTESR